MTSALALNKLWWGRWLDHVRQEAGSRMCFIIWLTSALACRAGEAVWLRRGRAGDVFLDGSAQDSAPTVHIRQGKSPGKVYLRPEYVADFKEMLKHGVTTHRRVGTKHGQRTRLDTFKVPKEGFMFRTRKGSSLKHLGYHAVWAAVSRCAKSFSKKHPGSNFDEIRSHSGRTSAITTMLGEGVPIHLSMKIARHANGSINLHLDYAQHTVDDVDAHFRQRGTKQLHTDADPLHKPDSAPNGKCTHVNQTTGLEGATLKDLVSWHVSGHLSKLEFERCKQQLPCLAAKT